MTELKEKYKQSWIENGNNHEKLLICVSCKYYVVNNY